MTATVSGPSPYGAGMQIRFHATARASLDGSPGTHPGVGAIALTELGFSADRALSTDERAQVGAFVAVLGHHVASTLLGDARPPIPVPALMVPTSLRFGAGVEVPTGVAAGTLLGARAPAFSIVGDQLEASGAFGEL